MLDESQGIGPRCSLMRKNKSRIIYRHGEVNLAATARTNGLKPVTLRQRIRRGLSLSEALVQPMGRTGITRANHGKIRPEYISWRTAKNRVTNPNGDEWCRYGERGIKMCERWMNSFEAFLDDMGPKPSPDLTLERKDNDGDYCPENCRWATRKEQASNRSDNVFVDTPWGTHTLAEACRKAGVNYQTIRSRMRAGYSPEEAIFR